MTKYITIDRGNTTTKVAVHDGDAIVATATGATPPAAIAALPAESVVGARVVGYCSVGADEGEVAEVALQLAGIPLIEVSASTPLPIAIDYRSASTLGADRIAAAVGAAWLVPGRPLLVVDAGTAVTYDYVTADGHFAGGNIAPGIRMRLEALHRYTARLPLPDVGSAADDDPGPWGKTTAGALVKGAVSGVVAEIGYYRSLLPQGARVIVSGGDARLLAPLLDGEVAVEPHLVNHGLNKILQYNEKN